MYVMAPMCARSADLVQMNSPRWPSSHDHRQTTLTNFSKENASSCRYLSISPFVEANIHALPENS
jgi:hypothetical protein